MPFLPVVVAAALTASVCIPTVPTARRYPPALPFVATQHWSLATGSWVAAYHYPPANAGTRHPVPLVYLNGGPVRGISVLDHRFLQLLARQGYDVYAYEAAGGGRSDLLPMGQYTISRSVRDLAAFVDRLHKGRVDFLGFSSGAVVLTRALADPRVAARLHRAIIAEPGPMDGPTAHITGHKGQPSARGLAPAMTGPRSTHVPRYGVAFGLIRLGLLTPDTGLIGQAEGDTPSPPQTSAATPHPPGTASTTTTTEPPPSSPHSLRTSPHPCRTPRPATRSPPSCATTGEDPAVRLPRRRANARSRPALCQVRPQSVHRRDDLLVRKSRWTADGFDSARFHEMRAPLPASSWGTPRAVHRNRIGRKGC
ncbi:alpha/beta fold hydrolase [Streptomyces sp. NPDC056237]|uniref:alpha/beta fold hydrolase n=1 Tax=Streptomyces sp. NPDC056237 TaxID=3345758 RepID=UPI0035D82850